MEPPPIAFVLDEIPNWIGAAAAVVGVLFGLRQLKDSYQQRDREQQWKRAEFVAEKMKEFFDQRQVQTAMWLAGGRTLILGATMRTLL